ncbi:hypothetical protein [Senegalia massiliensis]|uniref:Uncharacterized protein n=1 Tax=Senegalia massiliensis TaxID=1720316 RepID=A0A845QY65_9CLOT|nr:hypothetical protein [Senegalia massiliensis]NBI06088.1 hypothetical protein [Senegalia massiliensis]
MRKCKINKNIILILKFNLIIFIIILIENFTMKRKEDKNEVEKIARKILKRNKKVFEKLGKL